MIAFALFFACSGDDGTEPTDTTDTTDTTSATAHTGLDTDTDTTETGATCVSGLTIGTGELAYEPLGAELTIVNGPQGGWHLLGGAQSCALDTGALATVAFTAVRVRDELVVGQSGPITKPLIPIDSCCGGVSDVFTFLMIDGESRPDQVLDGETVRFSVTLTLADGTEETDEAEVVLRNP